MKRLALNGTHEECWEPPKEANWVFIQGFMSKRILPQIHSETLFQNGNPELQINDIQGPDLSINASVKIHITIQHTFSHKPYLHCWTNITKNGNSLNTKNQQEKPSKWQRQREQIAWESVCIDPIIDQLKWAMGLISKDWPQTWVAGLQNINASIIPSSMQQHNRFM